MTRLQHLTPKQRELEALMEEISEECWCAGWLMGLEYGLWDAVTTGYYAGDRMDPERLRALSDEIGGWLYWSDDVEEPTFIPMAEWLVMYEKKGGK